MHSRNYLLVGNDANGSSLSFSDCMDMSLEELVSIFHLRDVKRNTGDYLTLDYLREYLEVKPITKLETASLDDSAVIITDSFSNLAPKWEYDCSFWNGLLNRNIGIVLSPLGLRAWEDGKAYLSKDIIRLLQQIAEQRPIGVTGEWTADVLDKLQIHSVRVIGCPGVYAVSPNRFTQKKSKIEKIHFHFTPFYRDFYQWPVHFYKQSMPLLRYFQKIYNNGKANILLTLQYSFLRELTTFVEINGGCAPVQEMVEDCGQFFFQAKEWIHALEKMDLSIGSEFEGAVAAMTAGVPSILFSVDPHTEEMAKFHHLSWKPITQFDSSKPLDYYLEEFDCSEFIKHFIKNEQAWFDFCDACNIKRR